LENTIIRLRNLPPEIRISEKSARLKQRRNELTSTTPGADPIQLCFSGAIFLAEVFTDFIGYGAAISSRYLVLGYYKHTGQS